MDILGAGDIWNFLPYKRPCIWKDWERVLAWTNSEKLLYWPKVNLYYKDLNDPVENLTVKKTYIDKIQTINTVLETHRLTLSPAHTKDDSTMNAQWRTQRTTSRRFFTALHGVAFFTNGSLDPPPERRSRFALLRCWLYWNGTATSPKSAYTGRTADECLPGTPVGGP